MKCVSSQIRQNMETKEIYLFLKDEGTDVWRPVMAQQIKENIFKIPKELEVPEEENWEFSPGQIVKCLEKKLSQGPCRVAVEEFSDEI